MYEYLFHPTIYIYIYMCVCVCVCVLEKYELNIQKLEFISAYGLGEGAIVWITVVV